MNGGPAANTTSINEVKSVVATARVAKREKELEPEEGSMVRYIR